MENDKIPANCPRKLTKSATICGDCLFAHGTACCPIDGSFDGGVHSNYDEFMKRIRTRTREE